MVARGRRCVGPPTWVVGCGDAGDRLDQRIGEPGRSASRVVGLRYLVGAPAQRLPGGSDVLRREIGEHPAHPVPIGPARHLTPRHLALVPLLRGLGADRLPRPVEGSTELGDRLAGCIGDDSVLDQTGLVVVEVGRHLDQAPHMSATDLAALKQTEGRGEQGEQSPRDRLHVLGAMR